MKVSIIIPAYNEEKTIDKLLKAVVRMKGRFHKETIVVDDGSTDKTASILKKYKALKNVQIIINKRNMGKGYSINKALRSVSGQVVVIQDADLEYNPKELPSIISLFKDKNTKVVYGSRILGNNHISHWTFNLGGKLLTKITNYIYGIKITDEATGYKLFRTNIIKSLKLKSRGFEFCPEVTAKIAKRGIKIVEVPITYNPRPISEKKIRWWDGILAIFYLIKYRFLE